MRLAFAGCGIVTTGNVCVNAVIATTDRTSVDTIIRATVALKASRLCTGRFSVFSVSSIFFHLSPKDSLDEPKDKPDFHSLYIIIPRIP